MHWQSLGNEFRWHPSCSDGGRGFPSKAVPLHLHAVHIHSLGGGSWHPQQSLPCRPGGQVLYVFWRSSVVLLPRFPFPSSSGKRCANMQWQPGVHEERHEHAQRYPLVAEEDEPHHWLHPSRHSPRPWSPEWKTWWSSCGDFAWAHCPGDSRLHPRPILLRSVCLSIHPPICCPLVEQCKFSSDSQTPGVQFFF